MTSMQPLKPSDRESAPHEASGHYAYRDWCRACAGGARRSDAHKRQREEQKNISGANMDYKFFTDRREQTSKGEGEVTSGATPSFRVPTRMTWSMPVQCKCVKDQTAVKETVECLNRLGYR